LVALWREALLAQKVLAGETRGYRHHPQLQRFCDQPDASGAIAAYPREVRREAERRSYRFDDAKIGRCAESVEMPVTRGQMDYELAHLCAKLELREPEALQRIEAVSEPEPHQLFRVVEGDVEAWEVLRR
jgi:hypothetical protein